jgi:hypothetical protein
MQPFKVETKEAQKFAEQWNIGGIYTILPPEAIQFATDFANVALNSFIAMCKSQAQAEAAQQAAKAAELKKPNIILEGIR